MQVIWGEKNVSIGFIALLLQANTKYTYWGRYCGGILLAQRISDAKWPYCSCCVTQNVQIFAQCVKKSSFEEVKIIKSRWLKKQKFSKFHLETKWVYSVYSVNLQQTSPNNQRIFFASLFVLLLINSSFMHHNTTILIWNEKQFRSFKVGLQE